MDNDFPTRMAGQALCCLTWVNQEKVIAKKPEKYPAKPRGGMSHGPKLIKAMSNKKAQDFLAKKKRKLKVK